MEIKKYEDEFLNILESKIVNKALYINTLAKQYPHDADVILKDFSVWKELNQLDSVNPSVNMDQAFYKTLSEIEYQNKDKEEAKIVSMPNVKSTLFSLQRLGIAMTFLVGIGLGSYLKIFSSEPVQETMFNTTNNSGLVKFASTEKTPFASDRIKGINVAKHQPNLDDKILKALNEVICFDPNINVRLSAIETLVLFWNNPEARAILIKSIPYQESPIVQLELADIMISMEAKTSSDNWNQLLSSSQVEPDIRSQLENTLKEIL